MVEVVQMSSKPNVTRLVMHFGHLNHLRQFDYLHNMSKLMLVVQR